MVHRGTTPAGLVDNVGSHRRGSGPGRNGGRLKRLLSATFIVLLVGALAPFSRSWATAERVSGFEIQSLDGLGNNREHPEWGQAGVNYLRLRPGRYGDGRGEMIRGPNVRRVSNRIYNDRHQNIFSETGLTQWGFTWGQFTDHVFGLREAPGVGNAPDPSSQNIKFDPDDPLEEFESNTGEIPFTRSSIADGTGEDGAREQVNTVSSYIDASTVYGDTVTRLEWLRNGKVDANIANNKATLFLPEGNLPRRDSRGDAESAPAMDVDRRLKTRPGKAAVAGDVRANENVALTATHLLFAREHNRIVRQLPDSLSEEAKFQIARRIVIAEQQFITYEEFLPAVGVRLPEYRGYDPDANATLGNEFATVGYRAHSMIHAEIEVETDADRYSAADIAELKRQGVEVERPDGSDEVALVIPINVASFNPDLVELVQVGPLLQGIGLERQYNNDEQIDNQLRSVLFEVPSSENPECLDGEDLPECFNGVVDLGAIDVERGSDHGMPTYSQLRRAMGLSEKRSFTGITGEKTDEFPEDPALTPGREIDDPDCLDFVKLLNGEGEEIDPESPEAESDVVVGIRRTTTAARLRALYGSVDKLDAFTGMISERHLSGSNLGELQHAMWAQQFAALRDGDRFFYLNDPGLSQIKERFGLDFRVTLGDVIAANTDIPRDELADNVFQFVPEDDEEEGTATEPTRAKEEKKQKRTVRLEAERARIAGGQVDADHRGFSGSGFVDTEPGVGSFVEWRVVASSDMTVRLTFGFANGSDTTRPMRLRVNRGSGPVVEFPDTGGWGSFRTTTVTVRLREGPNTLRLTAAGDAGGPNLDYVDIGRG
jgi:hypothetical protein